MTAIKKKEIDWLSILMFILLIVLVIWFIVRVVR